jgi:hypothetical protein
MLGEGAEIAGLSSPAEILQTLLNFSNQSSQVFYSIVKAAVEVLGEGNLDLETALARLNHPLSVDYSNTILYGGLPVDTSVIIRCMIAAETSFNPCLDVHQATAIDEYGEAASAAATQTIIAVFEAQQGKVGCILDFVKKFRLLRYVSFFIRLIDTHGTCFTMRTLQLVR